MHLWSFATWITEDLKALIQQRVSVPKNVLKSDRENVSVHNNRNFKNKPTSKRLLRRAKSKYYNKKLEDSRGDTQATWRTIRELPPVNTRARKSPTHSDGDDTDNVKLKTDDFHKFFASMGEPIFKKSLQHL